MVADASSALDIIIKSSTPEDIRRQYSLETITSVRDLLNQALALRLEEQCVPSKSTAMKKKKKATKGKKLTPPWLRGCQFALGSRAHQLYVCIRQSVEKFQWFFYEGPKVLQHNVPISAGEAILADIQRFKDPGQTDLWRGPFALVELLEQFERFAASQPPGSQTVAAFAEAFYPGRWQTVRHNITHARTLKSILHHGSDGMLPFMAFTFHKWRELSTEEVKTFVRLCQGDDMLSALIVSFTTTIYTYRLTYKESISLNASATIPDMLEWAETFDDWARVPNHVPDMSEWIQLYERWDQHMPVVCDIPQSGQWSTPMSVARLSGCGGAGNLPLPTGPAQLNLPRILVS